MPPRRGLSGSSSAANAAAPRPEQQQAPAPPGDAVADAKAAVAAAAVDDAAPPSALAQLLRSPGKENAVRGVRAGARWRPTGPLSVVCVNAEG
jgi:hypothetical protein